MVRKSRRRQRPDPGGATSIPKEGSSESPSPVLAVYQVLNEEPGALSEAAMAPDRVPLTTDLLSPTVDQLASAYFMIIYLPNSSFHYISKHADSSFLATNPLSSTLQSAALACFALEHRSSQASRAARQSYVAALKQTNDALASSQLATKDATLASILLLGLVEATVFRGRQSPQSWIAHAEGAAALLQLRGQEQFASALGHELFVHASNNLRTTCLLRGKPVPAGLRALNASALSKEPSDMSTLFGTFLDRACDIRVKASRAADWTDVRTGLSIIAEARSLLDATERLRQAVPADWCEAVPAAEVPAIAFQGLGKRFLSHSISKAYTSLYMIELFLAERIWGASHMVLSQYAGQSSSDELVESLRMFASEATKKGRQSILEILATVPYFLTYTSGRSSTTGRYLIWPLSHVGDSGLCNAEARTYVLNLLSELDRTYGLRQATEAARMLVDDVTQEDWYVVLDRNTVCGPGAILTASNIGYISIMYLDMWTPVLDDAMASSDATVSTRSCWQAAASRRPPMFQLGGHLYRLRKICSSQTFFV